MRYFLNLKERGTNLKTEVVAGVTTSATMAYILAVNPGILSASGMDFGRVFAATAIDFAVAPLVMGLAANLPFALSAGMGLNAFFAYAVCLGMGYSWQWALPGSQPRHTGGRRAVHRQDTVERYRLNIRK